MDGDGDGSISLKEFLRYFFKKGHIPRPAELLDELALARACFRAPA